MFLTADYLNTLGFIKTIGAIGEAKEVFRNRVEHKKAVTSSEVDLPNDSFLIRSVRK